PLGLANGVRDLFRRGVLQEIADGAGLQRREYVLLGGVAGQHDDLGTRMALGNLARRLDSAHPGHLQVHERDVRPQSRHEPHGLLAIPRLADDLDARLPVQQGTYALPHHGVVVHEHDPNRGFTLTAHRGNSTRTRVPAPGALSTWSLPPSRSARSRIPRRPNPAPPLNAGSKPMPSSATSRNARPPQVSSRTVTWLACACRNTLFSASCASRYSSCSVSGGSRAAPAPPQPEAALEAPRPGRAPPGAAAADQVRGAASPAARPERSRGFPGGSPPRGWRRRPPARVRPPPHRGICHTAPASRSRAARGPGAAAPPALPPGARARA